MLQLFTILYTYFHWTWATELVLNFIFDFKLNERNGAYVPAQPEVNLDRVFIEAITRFTGIQVYHCTTILSV